MEKNVYKGQVSCPPGNLECNGPESGRPFWLLEFGAPPITLSLLDGNRKKMNCGTGGGEIQKWISVMKPDYDERCPLGKLHINFFIIPLIYWSTLPLQALLCLRPGTQHKWYFSGTVSSGTPTFFPAFSQELSPLQNIW